MLIKPNHPTDIPVTGSPAIRLPPAIIISKIPAKAGMIFRELAEESTGPDWFKISSTPNIARLNMQLPQKFPRARSGCPTIAAELMPVTISGNEVTRAIRTIPIHRRPAPVFSLIASP